MRVRRAVGAGLVVWLLTGVALFSHMARLHPRYAEVFVPAVAALLGIGAAWVSRPTGKLRLAVLAGTMVIVVVYSWRLLYGVPLEWWIALAGAIGALAAALLARDSRLGRRVRAALAPGAVLALLLVAVLAVPVGADLNAIRDHVTDAGYVGALPREEQRLVSAYLRAHQGHARYEVAAQSATGIGSLIVQDARPIVVLTSYGSRVFTSVPKLKHLIAEGKVRYAFLNTTCRRRAASQNPACTAPVKWIRAHGTDVSAEAGLDRKVLWLLPGASR